MIAAIIIGIIILFFIFIIFYMSDKEKGEFNDGVSLGITITILICIEGLLIFCINKPRIQLQWMFIKVKQLLNIR